uniref:Nuclear egress protein 1 n=1 Tax=Otarine gammaherpesvirus 4 TaxID=2801541 RepID=A0A889IW46_9GAMA|nr:hypothetical protein [Otarine gammaherpesvirus 4]
MAPSVINARKRCHDVAHGVGSSSSGACDVYSTLSLSTSATTSGHMRHTDAHNVHNIQHVADSDKGTWDRVSVCSRRSRLSLRAAKRLAHRARLKRHGGAGRLLTDADFFDGISLNHELGKDFLREMDTPICTSNTIFLPMAFSEVAPGRCLLLSPFGHLSILGCYCDQCGQRDGCVVRGSAPETPAVTGAPSCTYGGELASVGLSFYNNADRVIQNRSFYLSLLSHSMDTVRSSFAQPSLMYAFLVFKTLCPDGFPVFFCNTMGLLSMRMVFQTQTLHLSEVCLRLLTDNLQCYSVTVDCVKQAYVVTIHPLALEDRSVTVAEDAICDAVSALDYSDELKHEILTCTSIATLLPKPNE